MIIIIIIYMIVLARPREASYQIAGLISHHQTGKQFHL